MENIKKDIMCIFEENGVDVNDPNMLEQIDSLQYITIIVEVEQLLDIALPDFVISSNAFKDFDGFLNIVMDTYQNR